MAKKIKTVAQMAEADELFGACGDTQATVKFASGVSFKLAGNPDKGIERAALADMADEQAEFVKLSQKIGENGDADDVGRVSTINPALLARKLRGQSITSAALAVEAQKRRDAEDTGELLAASTVATEPAVAATVEPAVATEPAVEPTVEPAVATTEVNGRKRRSVAAA